MIHSNEIVQGLTLSLEPFAKAIDVGIVAEPVTVAGYAVLGKGAADTPCQDLAHTVS